MNDTDKIMQVSIIKPGLLSTIQDRGRPLHRHLGVPVSGAMDPLSAHMANMAVGNEPDTAILELTYGGAMLRADTALLLSYAGDGAHLYAGQRLLPAERPLFIPEGTVLHSVANPAGSRTYLAVSGGWDVPEVMGSRSTCLPAGFGGLHGRALIAGDRLRSLKRQSSLNLHILAQLRHTQITWPAWQLARTVFLPADRKTVRVVPGREFTWFRGSSLVDFLSRPYTCSHQSNRIGYVLQGKPLRRLKKGELLSTAVTPGTIQVNNGGGLMILMADAQTTGGYPRLGYVAYIDLPLCGQLKPGDRIFFKEISRQEAEKRYLEQEKQLTRLTTALLYRFADTSFRKVICG